MQESVDSPLWWSQVEQETFSFKEPFHQPKAFGSDLFEESDVLNILRAMSRANRQEVNLRVYIDSGLRHDYEILVLQNPPLAEESLEAWYKRIFSSNRFCIAINNAEKYFDTLTRRCALIYKSYLLEHPMPAGGVDMGIFMGNYEWTPFGVHHDGDGVSILHFHAGPNAKTLYMWANDRFRELTGSTDSYFSPGDIIEDAVAYELHKCSFFFMPEMYHIGRNNGFSVDLTLGVSKLNASELISRSLSQAIRYFAAASAKDLKYSDIEEIASAPIVNNAFLAMNTSEWALNAILDYKLSLLSNCAFETPPLPLKELDPIRDNTVLQSTMPFKIYLRDSADGKQTIFARKNRISVAKNSALYQFVTELNSGKSFTMHELETSALCQDWSPKSIRAFFKSLLHLRALEISPTK